MYPTQTIPQQSMQQPAIANPSAPLPPQVPPGWTAHWDQSQQKFYPHNSMTGTVPYNIASLSHPYSRIKIKGWSASYLPRNVWLCNEESSNSPNTAWQNTLPASSPRNVHYPPQQQQIQGFDPSVTPAPQYQQQYQHPANIPVDPTAVGQPQPQHQQRQRQYGSEEYGGEGYGGKEYGGEAYCGERYGECTGGRGFDYGSGGFGGMLGGGGDDPAMTARLNAELLAYYVIITGLKNSASYIPGPAMTGISSGSSYIYNPYMTGMLNAQSLAHDANMTGLKNSASYIYDPVMTGKSNSSSYTYDPYMTGTLNAQSLAHDRVMTGLKNAGSYI